MATAFRELLRTELISVDEEDRWPGDIVYRDPHSDLVMSFNRAYMIDGGRLGTIDEVELRQRAWKNWPILIPASSKPRANRERPHREALEQQIVSLRAEAHEEGESFDDRSAALLLRYCDDLAADVEPAVFRLANGNLRAVWQDEQRDQIAIQFFPDGQLQYVILHDRRGRTLKTLGVEEAETIGQIVSTLRLTHLWFHGQG